MFPRKVLKHRVHVHTNADDDDDDDDDVMMMMMMMMMMTLMKLVNSATKFRHGLDKFYQPNSRLRGSKSRDEAIYTHVILQVPSKTQVTMEVKCNFYDDQTLCAWHSMMA